MMLDLTFLSARPIVVALAGSNGAGKSTFYQTFLTTCGLRFVNADELAEQLAISPYEAAQTAAAIRNALIAKEESFIFETVFSDPVGEKVEMLRSLTEQGYEVVLIFIRIEDAATSIQRVSMRVAQGGHDVPDEKLLTRFERTRQNLQRAIKILPHVLVFDNTDLADPYRHVATHQKGSNVHQEEH